MFQDSPVMGPWKSLGLLTDIFGLSHCIPGRILFLKLKETNNYVENRTVKTTTTD